ncbi:hypothetical protein TL16_g12832 [Triparma laevis f. inornata]|uniref:Fe2OG dioxygenase domain-containing protein n=1 Tax=Triparma laevis f. inornata TaxID=1714386 RepID=A0A9W7EY77_9STRA|nr:hypothetical protein TL16_g12832 [Triparma laevis f. inornata]
MSKCLICQSEEHDIVDPVTFLPCASPGCKNNVYCRGCLDRFVKDYASKCVACNGKIRITRGTKLYGDATAAMKKNEAQREEARRAEGLEQAHMVMKDGELRAAYKAKIAEEDKEQESLSLAMELSRENSIIPEVTAKDLAELQRFQREADKEEAQKRAAERAAEIEASEKLIQSLTQEEESGSSPQEKIKSQKTPISDENPITSASTTTSTTTTSASSSAPKPKPSSPSASTKHSPSKLGSPSASTKHSPFKPSTPQPPPSSTPPTMPSHFKPSDIQRVAEELTAATSAPVAAAVMKRLLHKRVKDVEQTMAFLPRGTTLFPKFLKTIKKRFAGSPDFHTLQTVYDQVTTKIQKEYDAENCSSSSRSIPNKPKAHTITGFRALPDKIPPNPLLIDDDSKNLRLRVYGPYEPANLSLSEVEQNIKDHMTWYRVKYSSGRFNNECETPCYTNYFGGVAQTSKSGEKLPYQEIPGYLKPLTQKVSDLCGVQFNSFLVRLYFNGKDNIAHHTDGRTFLGEIPTIASLSLGATATFELKRMNNVWPDSGTPDGGEDKSTPHLGFKCKDRTLLIMEGDTQDHWHHRVPQESRGPRININFRYIVPTSSNNDVDTEGQKKYYKYMVYGDYREEWESRKIDSWSFDDLMKLKGGVMSMFPQQKKELPQEPSKENEREGVGVSGGEPNNELNKENKKEPTEKEPTTTATATATSAPVTYKNSIFKSSARPAIKPAVKRSNADSAFSSKKAKLLQPIQKSSTSTPFSFAAKTKPKTLTPGLTISPMSTPSPTNTTSTDAPTADGPSEASEASEIKTLVEMGFSKEHAIQAIKNHPGDFMLQMNECIANNL